LLYPLQAPTLALMWTTPDLRSLFGLLACAALIGCASDNAKTGGGSGGSGAAGKGEGAAGKSSGTMGAAGAAGKDSGKTSSGAAGNGTLSAGEPIKADDKAWTWIAFPDTHCRDGSTAGVAVSLNSASKKVMIFLEGGGACFDVTTCLTNPANVGAQGAEKTAGVFDRTNAENPVKDWNFVDIPYCTGDVHAGAKDDGSVMGVTGTQHFVGRLNMEAFLRRLVPTFKDVDQVLLTGVSAGGFGAAANNELVQKAFGSIPVTMIDDSGPPMSSQYIPKCLQDEWRTTWGFDNSLLKDCGSDCPDKSDFDIAYTKHVVKALSGKRFAGLVEASGDGVITIFYGYGTNDCTGSFLTPVPAQTFSDGLLDFRSTIMGETPNFGTYYISSTQHTWIGGPSFYSTTVGGTRMVDWFKNIVEGTSATHVGP
jgi:hypothetical protein